MSKDFWRGVALALAGVALALLVGLAWERGYNSGYNDGYNDGDASGYYTGWEQGVDRGWGACIEENNLYNRY